MIHQIQQTVERYPTIIAFIALSLGVLAAWAVHPSFHLWFVGAFVAAAVMAAFGLTREPRSFLWITAGVLFFVMGLNFGLKDLNAGNDFFPARGKRIIHATVDKVLASRPDFRMFLVVSGMDVVDRARLPGRGRFILRDNPIQLSFGDRIAFRSSIRKPRNRGNPGEHDWEIYCRERGILWQASARGTDSVLLLHRGSPYGVQAILFKLREQISQFLEDHSAGEVRAVLKGIVVGDRGEIDIPLQRAFAQSGLAHTLSASGLHVGIVAMLALLFMEGISRIVPSILLWIPFKKGVAAVSVPAMLAYCLLVGARIPAIRATIMGIVIAGAILLDRRWQSLNSLALAGLIILLVYPLSLFTLGFQLSFVAVLGILLVVPDMMNRLYARPASNGRGGISGDPAPPMSRFRATLHRLELPIVGLFLTTVAATLATSPISLMVFHTVPTYSLFANLLAVPLLSAALLTAIAASVVGLVSSSAGAWILAPAAFLVQIIVDLARFFSHLPGSSVHVPEAGALSAVLIIILAISVIWFIRKPCLNRCVVPVLSAVSLAGFLAISSWGWLQSRELSVVFFNVGKADAAFVKPPGSQGIVIDSGMRNAYYDTGLSLLIPYFERRGIHTLDGILVSHPQMDHMGGVLSLIRRVPPNRLWWNPIAAHSTFMGKILEESHAQGIRIRPADRTCAAVRIGDVILRFLNLPGKAIHRSEMFRNINNASAVCRIEYGSISFLFTGDIEREAEEELVASGMPLRASVLKVAHHGCKKSSSAPFLEAVRPRIAVISCDDYPGRACPNAEGRQRLLAVGAEILWTGRDGAVTMQTDGRRLTARIGRRTKQILVEGAGRID